LALIVNFYLKLAIQSIYPIVKAPKRFTGNGADSIPIIGASLLF